MKSSKPRSRARALLVGVGVLAAAALALPAAATADSSAKHGPVVTVAAGETLVVPATTHLYKLVVEDGGVIVAPSGDSLTLTVGGIEKGQKLVATGATETRIQPGTYQGDVVLTVAQQNPVEWQGLTFPIRQALYVDADGVNGDKSVLAGVLGGRLSSTGATNIKVLSKGEAYNGVYVAGGSYTLKNPRINLVGNGRSDFIGDGAAIVATGDDTKLVVDGARIANQGAVRTGVVAEGGSNVVVKNSRIQVKNGTLPSDYVPTVDLAYMESVPWMLSLSGNNRATNLLGVNTKASYVNSQISSQGWGVLSTDSGMDGQLTAIDSKVTNTGRDGYGSYAIGNATERFLGNTFDVGTYATINRGGAVYYGDSTHEAVSALNTSLDLGLTAAEIDALPVRHSTVNSRRFGFMWHGGGTLDLSGGTVVNSKEATFLDKGQYVGITVDGSQGAKLKPANGILMQIMDDDDPGPVFVDGKLVNAGVYHEPTAPPNKVATFDVTSAHSDDATSTFTDTSLTGNFYNGTRGDAPAGPFGPGLPGRNLVLTLDGSSLTGVVTASTTKHHVDTITSANYEQLGEVTNTAGPVVNNGVIVTLNSGSTWSVTGKSYLSKLVVSADSQVTAGHGQKVSMTVDGVATPLVPGNTYTGAIVVTSG